MTQTQKKAFEWPLIFLLMWVEQAFEISILRIPFNEGPVNVLPVLISYLAVTRNFGWLLFLTFVFSFMGSSNVGYAWPIFVSTQMWTALVLKVIMLTFALEGRRSFTLLAVAGNLIAKVMVGTVLQSTSKTLPLWPTLKDTVATTLVAALLAWFLFPLFAAWDLYFEHEADEARELKPGALR